MTQHTQSDKSGSDIKYDIENAHLVCNDFPRWIFFSNINKSEMQEIALVEEN